MSLPTFRSKFEESIWEAAKRIRRNIQHEPHFIPYVMKGSYLPDFIIKTKSGKYIYVEAKGYLDAAACKKMKAVKASNPDLDIRFVFQDPNGKRNRRAILRNWEWAEKHKFPWAAKTIPLEWWRE
jgi:hypothetical protein